MLILFAISKFATYSVVYTVTTHSGCVTVVKLPFDSLSQTFTEPQLHTEITTLISNYLAATYIASTNYYWQLIVTSIM